MNPRFVRARHIAFVVILSVILAYLMSMVSQWTRLYKNMRPEQFARRNIAMYGKKLHLTPDQENQMRAILIAHKTAANQIDEEEGEGWEKLTASLANDSEDDLHRQVEALNALDARRNEIRLQTFLNLRQELNEDQKQQYSSYLSMAYQKYLNRLRRILR